MKIGELSKETGVSIRSLRYYEEESDSTFEVRKWISGI
nr:MerR family DNA-binding transcriptional regulator [Virgibacillus pantothenticus]